MRVRILAVGKIRTPYIAQACKDFSERLQPFFPLTIDEIKPSELRSAQAAVNDEGERLARRLRAGEPLWLLDRSGCELSSIQISARLGGIVSSGAPRLTLIVAGTYGASAQLHARADFIWSLSQLTLLHEWARALVLEQLYRAAKIARNEPYHH